MSCKKNRGSHGDCERQSLQRALDLTTTPTPILIVNEGDGFSRKRTLTIQATVAPSAVGPTVPATATFRLRVDGVLLAEAMEVVLFSVDNGIGTGDSPTFIMKAQVPVSAGAHEVALVASSDVAVDLAPGENGATLEVCS